MAALNEIRERHNNFGVRNLRTQANQGSPPLSSAKFGLLLRRPLWALRSICFFAWRIALRRRDWRYPAVGRALPQRTGVVRSSARALAVLRAGDVNTRPINHDPLGVYLRYLRRGS